MFSCSIELREFKGSRTAIRASAPHLRVCYKLHYSKVCDQGLPTGEGSGPDNQLTGNPVFRQSRIKNHPGEEQLRSGDVGCRRGVARPARRPLIVSSGKLSSLVRASRPLNHPFRTSEGTTFSQAPVLIREIDKLLAACPLLCCQFCPRMLRKRAEAQTTPSWSIRDLYFQALQTDWTPTESINKNRWRRRSDGSRLFTRAVRKRP